MKTEKIIGFFAAICSCAVILSYDVGSAAVVKQINLAEMTSSAEYIFSGACIDRETKYDEEIQRGVCVFTFRVDNMIKGAPRDHFSVIMSKLLVDIKQVPTFNVGDEVVVFLYGQSGLGLTSPVGLGQGKFSVLHMPGGLKKVVNANNNRNLFKGMDKPEYMDMFRKRGLQERATNIFSQKAGAVNYDNFLAVIEVLVRHQN